MAKRQYWLLKSEPEVYSYEQLEKDGRTQWTGIRNYTARNNLRAMKPGDLALYYHTGGVREVVGVAKIATAAAEDPTAPGEDWASVEVEPKKRVREPVHLSTLKADKSFKGFQLLTHTRLSVIPVSEEHFQRVLQLAKTKV